METIVEDEKPAKLQDVKPASEIPFFVPEGSTDGSSDAAFRADPTHVFLEGYRRYGPFLAYSFLE